MIVGLSGGIDSVVLLDILSRIAGRRRFHLRALHVNHQLSPNARRWAEFCRALCNERAIPLRVTRVTVQRGNSLEAAARSARYDVFRRQRADFVALAHNRDDQAETVLLQLLRGAGVRGLAAMPVVRGEDSGLRIEGKTSPPRSGSSNPQSSILNPRILRPLLDAPRSEIERYARRRKLKWIEDESNSDTYFSRNFLRQEVLPLIVTRFPAYSVTLARAARHFAEAAQLLDELAANDAVGCIADGVLQIAGLRKLSRFRAKNLLRHFLGMQGTAMPNAERLEEALRQSLAAKDDAGVCIDLGDSQLRRFAGALHVVPKAAVLRKEFSQTWRGERELALPELNGVLSMTKRRGIGISHARLEAGPVIIRVRRGGERLQPDCGRPRRSLRNLLQENAIAPWRRERMPLLYCGEALVWVPGIGIACDFQAQPGEPSLLPVWKAL